MSTYDEVPERLTPADYDLFAHDAKKPPHDVHTCNVRGCWNCKHWFGLERVIEETQAEEQYDADRRTA